MEIEDNSQDELDSEPRRTCVAAGCYGLECVDRVWLAKTKCCVLSGFWVGLVGTFTLLGCYTALCWYIILCKIQELQRPQLRH